MSDWATWGDRLRFAVVVMGVFNRRWRVISKFCFIVHLWYTNAGKLEWKDSCNFELFVTNTQDAKSYAQHFHWIIDLTPFKENILWAWYTFEHFDSQVCYNHVFYFGTDENAPTELRHSIFWIVKSDNIIQHGKY